jgi:hypothetical protein
VASPFFFSKTGVRKRLPGDIIAVGAYGSEAVSVAHQEDGAKSGTKKSRSTKWSGFFLGSRRQLLGQLAVNSSFHDNRYIS